VVSSVATWCHLWSRGHLPSVQMIGHVALPNRAATPWEGGTRAGTPLSNSLDDISAFERNRCLACASPQRPPTTGFPRSLISHLRSFRPETRASAACEPRADQRDAALSQPCPIKESSCRQCLLRLSPSVTASCVPYCSKPECLQRTALALTLSL
jgi:hypothetical protein